MFDIVSIYILVILLKLIYNIRDTGLNRFCSTPKHVIFNYEGKTCLDTVDNRTEIYVAMYLSELFVLTVGKGR